MKRDPKITMDTVRLALRLTQGRESEGAVIIGAVYDAAELERLERAGRRLGERQCNGVMRYDPKCNGVVASWDRLKSKANEIASRYGVTLTFNRDPRGSAIKIGDYGI